MEAYGVGRKNGLRPGQCQQRSVPWGRGRAEPAGPTEGGRVGLETPGGARTGGWPWLTLKRSW